ncbi:MAG: hypothetical protein ACSLE1_22465, partial [Sphingobium sp.]
MRLNTLGDDNWGDWKTRVSALLRINGLAKFIEPNARAPVLSGTLAPIAAILGSPTPAETAAFATWQQEHDAEQIAHNDWVELDQNVQALLTLSISNTQLVYITGAQTVSAMWAQLCAVKEPKGILGKLAVRRRLYRMTAKEGTSMAVHIAAFRKEQQKLALMGDFISEEDLALLLISSLPETWDTFSSAFFGSNANLKGTVSLSEIIEMLIEEDERLIERLTKAEIAHRVQFTNDRSHAVKPICNNCKRTGHTKENCYTQGGGKEGQAPWSKSSQKSGGNNRRKSAHRKGQETAKAAVEDLPDAAYIATFDPAFSKTDWLSDSGTSSHIATKREMFTSYTPIECNIEGVGGSAIRALGRGTVRLITKINGHDHSLFIHEVLHAPDAVNCLLSISKLDQLGYESRFKSGIVTHYSPDGNILATGSIQRRVYR